MYEFTFPPESFLNAGGYIVLARTAGTYANKGFQVFQITEGKQNNAGEELSLADPQGNMVDYVNYLDLYPWPAKPDGEGTSLELRDPSMDNQIADSWKASENTGGTPGRAVFTGTGEAIA